MDAKIPLHVVLSVIAALDEAGVLPMGKVITMIRINGAAAAANGDAELAAALRLIADSMKRAGE